MNIFSFFDDYVQNKMYMAVYSCLTKMHPHLSRISEVDEMVEIGAVCDAKSDEYESECTRVTIYLPAECVVKRNAIDCEMVLSCNKYMCAITAFGAISSMMVTGMLIYSAILRYYEASN
jgi:hypothetical protein